MMLALNSNDFIHYLTSVMTLAAGAKENRSLSARQGIAENLSSFTGRCLEPGLRIIPSIAAPTHGSHTGGLGELCSGYINSIHIYFNYQISLQIYFQSPIP